MSSELPMPHFAPDGKGTSNELSLINAIDYARHMDCEKTS